MTVVWEPALPVQSVVWRDKAAALTRDLFAPAAAAIDAEQRYPVEHLAPLLASGISGMFVPAEYGGSGASLTSVVSVVETVAQGCASTAAILAALSLGAFPVLLGGTHAQKMELLGGLATQGRAVNFALSERDAGSDPSGLQTVAVREGEGWRIRGEKCWLGNGGHSSHFIVFARSSDDERHNISAFVVRRDAPGVAVDFYEDKMGIRGTTTTNLKLDTWVPASAMVGEEGRGMRLALGTLAIGRVVVAAQANGIALGSYAAARDFAARRETFGKPIIDHQAIGFKLADSATALSASRMMTYEAARAYDAGQDIGVLGAMAKLLASENSHAVVDDAVQILGGRGYVKPCAVERAYRDQRITEIYEGTSEIQRLVIARAVKKEALSA
ncbi:acyl-CoA dehydrogenase family protein [Bordetella hinzii]|uniref:3-sulfinopropanoyl-CoA desulfinase n=1 Tax=Bordetella hinzii TaxID=103855 RepID=A0AAN1S0L8_9BORD|nr:acyl-CoA dehydrogenase family protein [Bordetella hinzii]AKQ58467.1 Acyl-CoA dehydrogenase [Bordetella hinzii]AZW19449.1 acyl-CoA dehydrogenase [Bordetella hinzii]KXA75023.1 acyl-CoA dehydrogenase [Bordetella hinzii LMG 13501]MBZ0074534.1 acyl-CoA dehydrogenase family protein [Bordetella hinzii]MBZ0080480.1 acyl-CoA dehydrogenase family protein [Bordetella hinzii]